MRTLLDALATVATRWPRSVLVTLAAATVGMAALATDLEVEVDLTQLGREGSEAVQAMDRVREEFTDPAATLQVILEPVPAEICSALGASRPSWLPRTSPWRRWAATRAPTREVGRSCCR
ncbi:hypothetical protein [Egibacter rhizosphaerae]|uniref:hypothetical protein n=1 Tax=Egibacter rhizosphaerae TaxID=1670831 RepID=UPI0013F146E7|nr:hypothetical protein [Egibacter rhizosphaerae]